MTHSFENRKASNNPESDVDKGDVVSDREANGSGKVETDSKPEYGGQKGPEPTRYGDWEKNGRCTDF